MKAKPCEKCPFRRDVAPYLTSDRGAQLAFSTRSPSHVFYCHESIRRLGGKGPRRLCLGYAILRQQEAGGRFVRPSDLVYSSMGEMILAYMGKAKL